MTRPPEIDIFASFLSSPAGEKMAAVPVLVQWDRGFDPLL
jgi:hypothetical protein